MIAVAVALLGFLLAIQLRSQTGLTDRLSFEREADLGQILSELTTRNDDLADQVLALELQLDRASRSREQEQTLIDAAETELRGLRVLLGLLPVKGQGVVMRIDDPQGTVGPELVLDAIQELRDAGAEAIEAGGVRVVAATAISGRGGALRIGGQAVELPLVITAVGDRKTLAEAMRIPGGTADSLGASPGASVRIDERPAIGILSTVPQPRFDYARP